jgi:PPOX class probable F420-dependent enzyme
VDELDDAKYISLTTYKRDGAPVATPVWIARAEEGYVFTTGPATWKARRLRRDPRVQVQVCDIRGRVKRGAAIYAGTGAVKEDAATVGAAEAAIHDKYGWQFRATQVVDAIRRRFHVGKGQAGAAIELMLTPAG